MTRNSEPPHWQASAKRRTSAIMRALRFDIDRIQRLARGHEQAIALLAAEAEIGAGLRQADLTDPLAVRRKDLDTVIAVADPSGTHPDIAFGVDAQAVREAGFAVERHVDQRARVRKLVAIQVVLPDDVFGLRIMGDAGVADIDLLVVVAKRNTIRLERFVGDL